MVLHLDAEDEMVVGDWVVYAGKEFSSFFRSKTFFIWPGATNINDPLPLLPKWIVASWSGFVESETCSSVDKCRTHESAKTLKKSRHCIDHSADTGYTLLCMQIDNASHCFSFSGATTGDYELEKDDIRMYIGN